MTDPLDELLALAEAATPGPWEYAHASTSRWAAIDSPTRTVVAFGTHYEHSDAAYIAALPPNVAKALVEVAKAAHRLTTNPFGSLSQRHFYELREAQRNLDKEMKR